MRNRLFFLHDNSVINLFFRRWLQGKFLFDALFFAFLLEFGAAGLAFHPALKLTSLSLLSKGSRYRVEGRSIAESATWAILLGDDVFLIFGFFFFHLKTLLFLLFGFLFLVLFHLPECLLELLFVV